MSRPSRTILVPGALHHHIACVARGDSYADAMPTEEQQEAAQEALSYDIEMGISGLRIYSMSQDEALDFLDWIREFDPGRYVETVTPTWISERLAGELLALRRQEGYPVFPRGMSVEAVMRIVADAQEALLFFGWRPTSDLTARQREVLSRMIESGNFTRDDLATGLAVSDPDPFFRNDPSQKFTWSRS